jgi:hypothetical protein
MAIQTTQMVNAQKLKNKSVNQSISAPKLRLKVGKAKAAKAAIPGNASKRALSDMPVNQVAATVTTMNHKGKAKCGKRQPRDSCSRQRHKDHAAKGQAGHVNHTINLASTSRSNTPPPKIEVARCGDAQQAQQSQQTQIEHAKPRLRGVALSEGFQY